ncbi:MAG: site-specific integrase [Spartobacteria bacterium]|nr:site-specific integrase [Spartobacteria bacterium]
MAKRIKTEYPGVVYLESTSKTGKTEKVFYIFYRRDGKQIEEKVGRSIRDNMTAAKANRIRSERIEGRQLPNTERRAQELAAKEAEAGRWSVGRIWTAYNDTHKERACAKPDRSYASYFLPEMGEKIIADIVTLDLQRLRRNLTKTKSFRTGKTLSAQTQKHVLALLKRMLRWAATEHNESISHIDFKEVFKRIEVDNEKTEMMTEDQAAAYFKALDEEPDQDDAAYFRLMILTGIRKTALLNLKWEDIDFEKGFLTLRREVAKKKKESKIPLSPGAIDVLKGITRKDSAYVWPSADGGPREGFTRMARRLRDKAGLTKDFRPCHGLRHHFASALVSSGEVTIYAVQKLLTHSNVSMTSRYAHLNDDALKQAVSVADEAVKVRKKAKVSEINGEE